MKTRIKIGFYKNPPWKFGFYKYHTLPSWEKGTLYGGWGFKFFCWGFYVYKVKKREEIPE